LKADLVEGFHKHVSACQKPSARRVH
jgi:hypothetical protein